MIFQPTISLSCLDLRCFKWRKSCLKWTTSRFKSLLCQNNKKVSVDPCILYLSLCFDFLCRCVREGDCIIGEQVHARCMVDEPPRPSEDSCHLCYPQHQAGQALSSLKNQIDCRTGRGGGLASSNLRHDGQAHEVLLKPGEMIW